MGRRWVWDLIFQCCCWHHYLRNKLCLEITEGHVSCKLCKLRNISSFVIKQKPPEAASTRPCKQVFKSGGEWGNEEEKGEGPTNLLSGVLPTRYQAPPLSLTLKVETMPFTHRLLKAPSMFSSEDFDCCLLDKAAISVSPNIATHVLIEPTWSSIYQSILSMRLFLNMTSWSAFFSWLLITRSIIFEAISFIFNGRKWHQKWE